LRPSLSASILSKSPLVCLLTTNSSLPPLEKKFPSVNPATEKVLVEVYEADKADVDIAVAAAKRALEGEWGKTGPKARRNLLLKFADMIEADLEKFARLESYNNGSPLGFQTAVIKNIPDDIRYFAGWVDKVDGRVVPSEPGFHVYTRKEPIGVCGLVLPWNVPLWAIIVKLAPCLAMGNVAVVKPAEQTPLTSLALAELFSKVGFPNGVLNILPGFGPTAGRAISSHLDIGKVAFTGSTEVGRLILEASAKSNLKKVQLELGGKSPFVIMPDADLDFAAKMAHFGVFSNNGQLCTASSRVFVHEDIHDKFIEKVVALAKTIKVGYQLEKDVTQGPLIDKSQFEKVLGYIETAKKEGATLNYGGNRVGDTGYFVEPTVFSNLTGDSTIVKEEIFGPVLSVLKFKTLDEAVERCNSTTYGLASGILTNNIANVYSFANRIKAGMVWVNTYHAIFPNVEFGGFKQSGFGREGGVDGINEWTQTKSVVVQTFQSHL